MLEIINEHHGSAYSARRSTLGVRAIQGLHLFILTQVATCKSMGFPI